MRILIVLAAAIITLTLLPTPSHADVIVIYADSVMDKCTAVAGGEYGVYLYIFHYSPGGATGSRFKVERAGCMDVDDIFGPNTWWAFPKLNWEFQYGACLSGWIYVGGFAYYDAMGLGGWGRCCEHTVSPWPTSGQVEAIDCAGETSVATTIPAYIDVDTPCPCGVASGIDDELHTTWGAIKALFSTE